MATSETLKILIKLKDSISPGLKNIQANMKGIEYVSGKVSSSIFNLKNALIGIGTGVVIYDLIKSFDDLSAAVEKARISLNLTSEETESIGAIIENVFVNGFKSISDASEIATESFRRFGAEGGKAVEDASVKALKFNQLFGVDMKKTISAASSLVENFGIDSGEAFDLIYKGLQDGLNVSGDFLETITEYGPQLKAGGANASEFFSILKTGFIDGQLGTDKAADAFKEFRIKMTEGSKDIKESFASLGLNYDKSAKEIQSGSKTIVSVFNEVLMAYQKTDTASLESQAVIAKLGTQFEDLASKAANFNTLSFSMDAVAGSSDNLIKKQLTLGQSVQSVLNKIKLIKSILGEAFKGAAISGITEFNKILSDLLTKMKELRSSGDLAKWGADIALIFNELIGLLNSFSSVISTSFSGVPDETVKVSESISFMAASIEKLPLFFQGAFAEIDLLFTELTAKIYDLSEVWYAVSGQFDKAFNAKELAEGQRQWASQIEITIETIKKEKQAIDEVKISALAASNEKIEQLKTEATKRIDITEQGSQKIKDIEQKTSSDIVEIKKDESEKIRVLSDAEFALKKDESEKIRALNDAEFALKKAELDKELQQIDFYVEKGLQSYEIGQIRKREAEKEFRDYKMQMLSDAVDAAEKASGTESVAYKNAVAEKIIAETEFIEKINDATAAVNDTTAAVNGTTDAINRTANAASSAASSFSSMASAAESVSKSTSSTSQSGYTLLSMSKALSMSMAEIKSAGLASAASLLGVDKMYSSLINNIRKWGGETKNASRTAISSLQSYLSTLQSASNQDLNVKFTGTASPTMPLTETLQNILVLFDNLKKKASETYNKQIGVSESEAKKSQWYLSPDKSNDYSGFSSGEHPLTMLLDRTAISLKDAMSYMETIMAESIENIQSGYKTPEIGGELYIAAQLSKEIAGLKDYGKMELNLGGKGGTIIGKNDVLEWIRQASQEERLTA